LDGNGKNSVLIVDDDYFDLEVLRNILEPEYTVYISKSGHDAVEMAVELLPDIILLDIMFPDIDGFEILSSLKKNEATKDTPVIIVTGLENVEGEEIGLDLEATDYIHKPFSAKIVKLRIRNQIQIVNHLKELIELHKKLENAVKDAENANKAKSAFLARMSHEIRTPLNAVLGISEIQLQNKSLTHDVKEAFIRIYNSGDLLLGIINDILDISKIEAGKLELVQEKYYVSSVINDTVYLNMIKYEDKGINFILNIDEKIPSELVGDEIRIKQILNNLLSNAFKYTAAGEVELSLKADSSADSGGKSVNLVLCVRDTGQGMTDDQLEKLFDEYARFNLETNRTTVGTGLGMGITRNLISMMNGEIKAESEKNKGSVFTVRLPQGDVNARPLGKESVEKLKQFRSSFEAKMKNTLVTYDQMPSGKVLIIDDNDMNLYVTKGMLLPYKLQIHTALSGAEGIEKIKKAKETEKLYDIVFLDHMMPVMDGIETAKAIRKLGSGYKKMPIIALTANAVAGMKNVFLENGFNDFISKPVNTLELDGILKQWISPDKIIKTTDADSIDKNAPNENDNFVDRLISIEEINVKNGLNFISGGMEMYKNTLEIFFNKIESECENMNAFLNGNDIQNFSISVHAMKSMLAIIGASELSEEAYKLEKASSNNDVNYCEKNFYGFKEKLLIVRKKLSDIFPGGDTDKMKRALLVDDTEMILLIVKDKLSRCGLNVDTAENGRDAIEKVSNNEYDIIFMDYLMPDINGIEVTKRIRKWEKDNNIKKNIIIALTANEDDGNKEMFLNSGFDAFVSKPVNTQDLEEVIDKWLPK